jgi:hypothetical protein
MNDLITLGKFSDSENYHTIEERRLHVYILKVKYGTFENNVGRQPYADISHPVMLLTIINDRSIHRPTYMFPNNSLLELLS